MNDQIECNSDEIERFWREAPCGLVALNAALQVTGINPAAARILARPPERIIGIPFADLLDESSRAAVEDTARELFRRGGKQLEMRLTLVSPQGASVEVQALARSEPGLGGLHISIAEPVGRAARQEFTEVELKNAELAASIVAASSDAILSFSTDGRILSWNQGAERLYGYSAEEAIGHPLDLVVPESRLGESMVRMRSVLDGDNIYFETERRHKSGDLAPVAISGGPIYDEKRKVVGVAAIHRDIRSQVRHEAQLRFVMRELAHRTKNLLAIIQSIERQTARSVSNTTEFHERFSSRLQALAASHDLLVETNWGGARIGDLIERQLAAFSDQIGGRILLNGPALRLSPEVAQTLGLALHELATNATKYGALSVPAGQVTVTWGVFRDEADAPRFRIEWRESGGPPVTTPKKRGFGSLAIERLAAQALNGEATLTYAADGLHWTLSSDPAYVEEVG